MTCEGEATVLPIPVLWGILGRLGLTNVINIETLSGALSKGTTGLATRNATTTTTLPGRNDCGESTFENQSTGGSPDVHDCQELIQAQKRLGGTFEFESDGSQHAVLTYGSGAIGVQTYCPHGHCPPLGRIVKIGDLDVTDLVTSAIDKFQWNGKVGAKGTMMCQEEFHEELTMPVLWGVYHT